MLPMEQNRIHIESRRPSFREVLLGTGVCRNLLQRAVGVWKSTAVDAARRHLNLVGPSSAERGCCDAASPHRHQL